MKNFSSAYSINYEQLNKLFTKRSDTLFELEPEMGTGSVQIFHLERGIEARFWDCSFKQELELYGHANPEIRNRHFTLICFINTSGLRIFTSAAAPLKTKITWNTMFISAKSNYRMSIAPRFHWRCLTISFTKTWLDQNVIHPNAAFRLLGQEVKAIDNFSLLGTMSAAQKILVTELLDFSWKTSLGSFYLKSSVLKIISDFLYKIRARETPTINNFCLEREVEEMKRYIE